MSAISAQEYDALIYPGFLRRNVARWNDDGSAAPLSRARGPKGETFVLQLRSGEIDQDVSAIEGEVRARTLESERGDFFRARNRRARAVSRVAAIARDGVFVNLRSTD